MSVKDFIKNAEKTVEKNKEIPEANIEKEFVDYAKANHCAAEKLVLLVGRGWPDRTVLCPGGIIIFIEFKKKGEPLTAKQVLIKRLIKRLGFKYYVCDQIGQAEAILDLILKGEI